MTPGCLFPISLIVLFQEFPLMRWLNFRNFLRGLICFRKNFLGRMLAATIVIILNHFRELNSSFDEIYYISRPVSHTDYVWWKNGFLESVRKLSGLYTKLSEESFQPTFSCSELIIEILGVRREICSKATIKTRERCHRERFVNSEHISHLVLVFMLLTLNK